MIVLLVVQAIFGALEGLVNLLPDDTLNWPDGSAVAQLVGDRIAPLDAILPLAELVAILAIVIEYVLPAVLVWSLTMWFYFVMPFKGT